MENKKKNKRKELFRRLFCWACLLWVVAVVILFCNPYSLGCHVFMYFASAVAVFSATCFYNANANPLPRRRGLPN